MADEIWQALRRHTPSRIGLGRSGDALPTGERLALVAAHARARDAVHRPLDVERLGDDLQARGFERPLRLHSQAPDRASYLRRPDLGRLPLDLSELRPVDEGSRTLAVLLADGLSPAAVQHHAVALLVALREELAALGFTLARPVVARQARVALGDGVGQALGAEQVLVLIGERPGLSATDSLGAYLTHSPRPGRHDAERNCVSNIRTPGGLFPSVAARVIAQLVAGAHQLGRTGVDLKQEGGIGAPPAGRELAG